MYISIPPGRVPHSDQADAFVVHQKLANPFLNNSPPPHVFLMMGLSQRPLVKLFITPTHPSLYFTAAIHDR
jgi:hypothetical protein